MTVVMMNWLLLLLVTMIVYIDNDIDEDVCDQWKDSIMTIGLLLLRREKPDRIID